MSCRRVQRLVVEHESRLLEAWHEYFGEAPGGGFGWPEVDEDLSTEGLLRGAPAPRGSAPTSRATGG
jgi:hypothetical protein